MRNLRTGVALGAALIVPALVGITGLETSASTVDAASAQSAKAQRPTVISSRVIGRSVRGHPIRAYELGSRRARKTVVALGAMHGNEKAGSVVLSDLRLGRRVKGVHLWVIPRANPDGYLRDRRHNARGVDLNRNYPRKWRPLKGYYYAGPRPASEPETRATMRFLNRIDPHYVISLHQPLRGVDVYGAKDRPFARRLARNLGIPVKSFDCAGKCHGTLTQWFNAYHRGATVTVEFGDSPSWRYLHRRAPRGILRSIGGYF